MSEAVEPRDELIAPADRREFLDWLVREHLSTVNWCGERLRFLQAHPSEAQPNEARTIMDRCARHAEALGLMGPSVMGEVGRWANRNLKKPVDAFAYGFAVAALGHDAARLAEGLAPAARPHAMLGAEMGHAVCNPHSRRG